MGVKFDKRKLSQELRKAVDRLNYDRAARYVVNRIKSQTRLGISPVTGKTFKPLTAGTIARRKKIAAINRTHPKYQPAESNLTFTGQLLNALTFAVTHSPMITTIVIFTKDTVRTPYKYFVKKLDPPSTNLEVQEKVELERPYIGLDNVGEHELRRIITNELEKELRKLKG